MHPWAFHWLHEISIPKRVRHRLEPEWEMRRTRWGGSTGCIMHRVHISNNIFVIQQAGINLMTWNCFSQFPSGPWDSFPVSLPILSRIHFIHTTCLMQKNATSDLAQNCVAQCAWIVSFRIAVKPASGGLCLSEALGIVSGLLSRVINLLNTDVIIMIGLCLITSSQ